MSSQTQTSNYTQAQQENALTRALPLVRDLIEPALVDTTMVVALADATGRLTYVGGPSQAQRHAERIGFTPGQDWSRANAGQNAPGAAINTARPAVVRRQEHTLMDAHTYSCSAAPLTGPDGQIMGALDLTGGDEAGTAHALALVRATAAAIQREWLLTADETVTTAGDPPRLNLLQPHHPQLLVHGRAHRLSERHAEILTVLATTPAGVSTEELLDRCYPATTAAATVRVELLRLRRQLESIPGAPNLASRPYRLTAQLDVDAMLIQNHLGRGDFHAALDLYRAPDTPRLDGAALELATATKHKLRESILSDADAGALMRYLEIPHVAGDIEAWQLALRLLPAQSPQRALVVAHLESQSRPSDALA